MNEDYFRICYDARAQQHGSAEDFTNQFCRVCRQQACKRAGAGQTSWLRRVLTQEERLLNNPQFADPKDPRFADISEQDFRDMFRQAVTLHIADIKGDWEPVTSEDVARFASGQLQPAKFKAPELPDPNPEATEKVEEVEDPDEPVIEWEVRIPSSKGPPYQVSLGGLPGQEMVWTCTCKGYQFGGGKPCKHIKQGEAVYARSRQMGLDKKPPKPAHFISASPPQSPQPKPTPSPTPELVPQPSTPPQSPRPIMGNTRVPEGGIMLGGEAPPPVEPDVDPWAVPTNPQDVVEVGARIRMGLGKKSDG